MLSRMAISATEAQEQLDVWLAASKAIASGKEVRYGEQTLRLEDANRVKEMIEFWSGQLTLANRQAGSAGRVSAQRMLIND